MRKSNIDFSYLRAEYTNLFLALIVAIAISVIIISASYYLSRQNPDSEKLSAYECGFEPYDDARHVFDVRFCVTAILFVVFDIEIMFLVPWCSSISKLTLISYWAMIDFLLELAIGFVYIWALGALEWD